MCGRRCSEVESWNMDLLFLIPLLGFIITLLGWFNQREQTRLAKQQLKERKDLDKRVDAWYVKHGKAVAFLMKISARWIGPSSNINVFQEVFPEKDLRSRMETYLGCKISDRFEPSHISRDNLLNPVFQKTINDILESVEKFKREKPDWAKQLDL